MVYTQPTEDSRPVLPVIPPTQLVDHSYSAFIFSLLRTADPLFL